MKEYKEYKIDLSMYYGRVREALSTAVQYHAFELGYKWASVGKEAAWLNSPYLFFDEGGIITHVGAGDKPYFEGHCGTLISAADFLLLNMGPEFQPGDKVLVRDFDDQMWTLDTYSHREDNPDYPYRCLESFWRQCLPYEGNECLLGTDEPQIVKG
jgi:hypothetical protein